MPAFGTTQTHGTLLKWLKKEGETVVKGEPIMEIETDKATVEVASPADGIVAGVNATEGQSIRVGKTIGWVLAAGEAMPNAETTAKESASHDAKSSMISHTVQTRADIPGATRGDGGRHILASPAARRIAKEKTIDLAKVTGSGPRGSVRAVDLERAMGMIGPRSDNIKPLSAMRRIIAERMTASKQAAPHFYLSLDIDMSKVIQTRNQWKSVGRVTVPSINDFIIIACATALKNFPELNASLVREGIAMHREINIGFAVALSDGLVVPVIQNAGKLSLTELASYSRELVQKAQNKKLLPSDYEGGTFTVSNLGMMGVDSFIAIINPPQAAILATGKVASRVVVEDDALAIRPLMTATLSVDHRVTDGASAARFLQQVKQSLEQPVKDD